ncbi:DUF4190 domain-containing protein [Pseudomonas machongensis]
MAMVFCRGCAKQLHETAHTCPHCGAPQFTSPPQAPTARGESSWLAITSLILGFLCVLAMFDEAEWDGDTLLGLGLFASVGLVLGIVSISQNKSGNGIAVAGVVMTAVSLLCFIGLSVN